MERSGAARDSAEPVERGDVARRDVAILYGEDAGEWSVYLKDEFLQHLEPEGVRSFQIGLLKDLQTAAHTLADYRCKFLVLTLGLLNSLDSPRSQLLSKVLQPPATVVLLLCGVPSSDDFYKVLPVDSRFKEVSAEQEPWEYVSMVISIAKSDPVPAPELKDLRPEMEVTEDLTDVLVNPDDFTEPLLVMPTQIPCDSVTKIYLFLKDHLSLEERPEVEFVTGTQQIKVQASMLNSQTVCLRSVELPAGPVILKLHCQQTLLGSAQLVYFSAVEKIKHLLHKVTDPIQFICQAFQISTQSQLDELLTKSLQNSLPSSRIGAFQSIGTDNHSPVRSEDYECPTLLHFAARNGLKHLTTLLLTCPGAEQASALLNSHGERPGEVAKRYGFQHIHELMDRFMESPQTAENQHWRWFEPSQEQEDENNIYEKMSGLLMANKFEGLSKSEEMVRKEDSYTLSMDKEDQYTSGIPKEDQISTVCSKKDRFTTAVAKEDCYTIAVDEEDPYVLMLDEEDRYSTRIPKEDRYTTAGPQKAYDTTAEEEEEDPYILVLGDDDHYTTARPKERCRAVEFDNNDYTTVVPKKDHSTPAEEEEEDPYILVLGDDDRNTAVGPKEDRYTTARPKERCRTVEFDNNDYTTVVPKKDRSTPAEEEEEDPYILVLGDDDCNSTVRPKEDRYTARPPVHCHSMAFDDDRYTTVVRKKHHCPAEVDEEDPYTLPLDEDLCTTAVPKEGCYAMARDGEVSGVWALGKEDLYDMVTPKEERYTAAVAKRDCHAGIVTREDQYTVDNPYDYILPQRKSSSDARKESRPPAPIPRSVALSEAPSASFIAQVFQQRTSREINEHIYGIMAKDVKTQRDRENIYSLAAPMRQAPGPPKLPNLYDKLSNVR